MSKERDEYIQLPPLKKRYRFGSTDRLVGIYENAGGKSKSSFFHNERIE